jgi:hypothetical protein
MSEYGKKRRVEDDNENKRMIENDLSEDEYEVEAIENHQVVEGKCYYCVKWKGNRMIIYPSIQVTSIFLCC